MLKTTQIYADRAENAEIWDKDGNRYDASSVYSVKGDTTLTARRIENSVQTGDGFPIFLLSGAMMAAAAGAVMLLLKRRKLMGE